ncbi:PspC domain-containing protein [Lederbergia graminis]|uniref:PspC domain-containing protein n=1 Tax=Lederbergia graminis TaxID=735518 RepID=A0ABW0LCE3_9BACI
MKKRLRRSATDRSLTGVCGGIAEYLGVSSFGVRLLFIIVPVSFLFYIILANTIPDSRSSL